jgi:hypothetical protein
MESSCCGADIDMHTRVTCSGACHEAYVQRLEREFGREKVIVDGVTGKAHLVPLRRIIEEGVRREELAGFPEVPRKSGTAG